MKNQNQLFKQRALKRSLVIAAAAFTCLGITADDLQKQNTTGKDQAAYGQKAEHGDKSHHFVKEAMMGGQMEVKMAQMGAQKAQNAEVKRLAERIVQDHQSANQELQQIAQKKNISADSAHAGNEAKHAKGQEKMTQLQNASGAEFDKEFTKCAINHHKKSVAKFEQASRDLQDAELKAFIDKTLPKLREHLTMAQTAAASVGLSQSDLAALDRESAADGSGAPAPGESAIGSQGNESSPGKLNPADDVDKANENKAREQKDNSGGAASGEQGIDNSSNTNPSIPDANSSPKADPEISSADTSKDASLIHTDDNLDRVDDASGASASAEQGAGVSASGNLGDASASVNADVDIDNRDADVRTDLDTDKGDGKILGLERNEGDGKTLGVETVPDDGETLGVPTQKGDGKILGLPTSNDDRKILGVIPWKFGKDKDADADAEIQLGDKSIKGEVDVDTDNEAVGSPGNVETSSDKSDRTNP